MKKSAKNAAPKHLSKEAQRWWHAIMGEYAIDDTAGQLILRTALEALDRLRACQCAIEKDGQTILDRFEQPKPHPLLSVERDARSALLGALKSLNLDLEPLRDRAGRPPGGGFSNGD